MGRTAVSQAPSKRRLSVWLISALLKIVGVFVMTSLLLVWVCRWISLPCSSVMAQHWIKSMWAGERVELYYRWRSFENISPHVALAVIAAEDQRFPDHHGFDLIEIRKVLRSLWAGKSPRGASTISQQVAKNLFLWQNRDLVRKGLEVWFTVLLEFLWPKERILEVYLNIAEFGQNIFGTEAASQRFFGKSADSLSVSEATRLAAVLPNPRLYHVDKPSKHVLARQRWIKRQMQQLGGVDYLDKLQSEQPVWNQNLD
ncbi:MAG: monofunctional biosynthetic peptidoglycan transglycosylase [Candidatus Contendobacter odensis]|uniref:Biosynthetic peptidoglycan transglycosylase n=1 Tax=Candidatus Contendibacter odensensis TaxID=1400860 RepID=A0A2G6PF56_9GAMM|nr:MAG: monofunctional biosynthetic peptidoglycan transglycosylase [Candidatus Contendobacter odensis]